VASLLALILSLSLSLSLSLNFCKLLAHARAHTHTRTRKHALSLSPLFQAPNGEDGALSGILSYPMFYTIRNVWMSQQSM